MHNFLAHEFETFENPWWTDYLISHMGYRQTFENKIIFDASCFGSTEPWFGRFCYESSGDLISLLNQNKMYLQMSFYQQKCKVYASFDPDCLSSGRQGGNPSIHS